jgi:hypothetical protein
MDEQQPQQSGLSPMAPPVDIARDAPEPDKGRAELVKDWCDRIEEAKKFWCEKSFDGMRQRAAFVRGKQWRAGESGNFEAGGDRYTANITLRHINQRVASIYAKNPKVVARPRPKMHYLAWDGTEEMLLAAATTHQILEQQQAMQQAGAGMGMPGAAPAAPGMPGAPMAMPMPAPTMDAQTAEQVLKDYQDGRAMRSLYTKMGRSLELVAQYALDEPIPKFKTQAKQLVRRVLTCGVGYVKLGYQRVKKATPDIDAKIKDVTARLSHIEQLMAGVTDGTYEAESKEAAELQLNLEALRKQQEIILREGVVFGFPKAWAIIPDPGVTQIKGFVGARWLAEEFLFTPEQVQEIYKIDVGKKYTAHTPRGTRGDRRRKNNDVCAVYEVYDLIGQVKFTVCLGYPDFLEAPTQPDVELEQFHPYYALTFNDVEDDEEASPMPPGDAELLEPMQVEYNRSREGMRVHRIANRPGYISPKGLFGENTKMALASHADHEIMEHDMPRDTDVSKALQPKPTIPIEQTMYDTEHLYVDIQRVGGRQSANLGGTSNATATEVGVAEQSRSEGDQSNVDDLDEFLTDVMRGVGQILLLNMDEQTVKKIAGPGAVWPALNRQKVVEELCLEIKAGSSGRPNRQGRMMAIEKTTPYILQTPGFKPRKVAELLLAEIDETLEIEEFYDEGAPSIVAMNGARKAVEGQSPTPDAQGAEGAANAPKPQQSPAATQNLNPAPGAAPAPAPATY